MIGFHVAGESDRYAGVYHDLHTRSLPGVCLLRGEGGEYAKGEWTGTRTGDDMSIKQVEMNGSPPLPLQYCNLVNAMLRARPVDFSLPSWLQCVRSLRDE